MKKLIALSLALMLTLSLAACGEKKTTTPPAAKPAATTAAKPAATPAAPAEDVAPADDAEDDTSYTLDYAAIEGFVNSGFLGETEDGSPVVFAIDAESTYGVIIFGDNATMTAASFIGPLSMADGVATIEDEANGAALNFGAVQTAEDAMEIDMGDIGTATLTIAPADQVLAAIKTAIDNYTHVV